MFYYQELRNNKPGAVSNDWWRSDACDHHFMPSLSVSPAVCSTQSHCIPKSTFNAISVWTPRVVGGCSCKSPCPSTVYATLHSTRGPITRSRFYKLWTNPELLSWLCLRWETLSFQIQNSWSALVKSTLSDHVHEEWKIYHWWDSDNMIHHGHG